MVIIPVIGHIRTREITGDIQVRDIEAAHLSGIKPGNYRGIFSAYEAARAHELAVREGICTNAAYRKLYRDRFEWERPL